MNAVFDGYERGDGTVGVRNHVLVLAVTGLVAPAARRITASVRGTRCITMPYSTGLIGDDLEAHLRSLTGFAAHPNAARTLLVSDNPRKAERIADAASRDVEVLTLDGCGQDHVELVARGTRVAARRVRAASRERRVPVPVAALRVALKCGRSDPSSGLVANPVTGAAIDRLLACGGTALFGEVVEWIGAEATLAARAIDAALGDRLVQLARDREARAVEAGLDLTGSNPSPTNIAAGLTTIEEKSLGGLSKTGTGPIRSVLEYARPPAEPGLHAMDTPNYAPEHLGGLAAAGCQVALFTTGAGNGFTSGLMPTLKISAGVETCRVLPEQIDVDLSDVIEGAADVEAGTERLWTELLAVAGGTSTWGEILGEDDDVVSRFGAAL